jgi:hypothetical protein
MITSGLVESTSGFLTSASTTVSTLFERGLRTLAESERSNFGKSGVFLSVSGDGVV